MSRKRSEQPAYRYLVSGQARLTLGEKDVYLGKRGTPESYACYDSLLAECNANGKEPTLNRTDEPETNQAGWEILVKHASDCDSKCWSRFPHRTMTA